MQILQQPRQWIRALGDRLLSAFIRVSAEETAADLTAASFAARRRTVETALEAIDFANSVETGSDEAKAKILNAFRADIADIAALSRSVLSGSLSAEAGEEKLGNAPFKSERSETPSVNGHGARPLPKPEPTALLDQTTIKDGTSQEPPKRRGRPPKHPRPEATA